MKLIIFRVTIFCTFVLLFCHHQDVFASTTKAQGKNVVFEPYVKIWCSKRITPNATNSAEKEVYWYYLSLNGATVFPSALEVAELSPIRFTNFMSSCKSLNTDFRFTNIKDVWYPTALVRGDGEACRLSSQCNSGYCNSDRNMCDTLLPPLVK